MVGDMAERTSNLTSNAMTNAGASGSTYAGAGVNIAEGARAVDLLKAAVKRTHGPEVLAGVGAFGGMFDARALKDMDAPVLVASTDGVGTKTRVAGRMDQWDTVGQDLVNHCVNDILVQGARPLFFMDYVAAARLDAEQVATIVGGMATACQQNGCALLGGETAEMPGIYQDYEIDVAGTIVGVVDRAKIVDGSRIQAGDAILALPSTGLHTNGYSLARRALAELDWNLPTQNGNAPSIGEMLLAVHRSYLGPVTQLQQAGIDIRGMAHITGGALPENFPRLFRSNDLAGEFQRGTWPVPPIFDLIQEMGHITDEEMFNVFNMGIGLCVVVPQAQVDVVLATLGPNEAYAVGNIVPRASNRAGDAVIIN